jgi:transposase
MYQDRGCDLAGESGLQARRRVGELLDVKPETLRGWVERAEIDAGQRPGVPSAIEARIKELEREKRAATTGEWDPQDGVRVFRPG